MGEKTGIEWTDHTFNPWRGCTKVSPGCEHCYAETLSHRNPDVLGEWGPKGKRVIAKPAYWAQPLRWDKQAAEAGIRRRVFCASLADVFEFNPEVVTARVKLFNLIDETPHLDWLLLTKRPENIIHMLPVRWADLRVPANVWLGVSVETQRYADKRIPLLLEVGAQVQASVLFLSCEPLLDPVSLETWTKGTPARGIDWVIVGGESGPGARPMHPGWARNLRDECTAAGIPFFFKQWGGHGDDGKPMDKRLAGKLLDGRTWQEFPQR